VLGDMVTTQRVAKVVLTAHLTRQGRADADSLLLAEHCMPITFRVRERLDREVAADPDSSAPQRVAAIVRCGRWDGLNPAGALGDDPHTPPASRWQIATRCSTSGQPTAPPQPTSST
jgi:hypothetical protein